MTKCVCDKCGKVLKGICCGTRVTIRSPFTFGEGTHIDLCNDCTAKLRDFINGKVAADGEK